MSSPVPYAHVRVLAFVWRQADNTLVYATPR